ncbi:MAG: hypothetical protein KUG75_09105 [Pseudomonadales bacterium]|nr:hypothetical protein [Pseudomonadales bacterium]
MQEINKNTDRIFRNTDGNWYARIRGNYTLGPYASNSEAKEAIQHYINARSPDFISLNLPRWLHGKFWLRLFSGSHKNLPLQKGVGQH